MQNVDEGNSVLLLLIDPSSHVLASLASRRDRYYVHADAEILESSHSSS